MNKHKPLIFSLIAAMSLIGGLSSCSANNNKGETPIISGEDDEYIVKFNNNYDGTVIKVIVKAGETVSLPENPTRQGYNFGGWYTSYREDASEKFDEKAPINQDVTVYAKWIENINEHIVTFHYLDKVTPDHSETINHGSKIAEPTAPTYPDGTMAFTGWYKDAECTESFDFNSLVNSNLELYAGWKISKATVIFNYNFNGSSEPVRRVVDIDVPLEQPDDPTRLHYSFKGWFSASVGGEKYDFTKPVSGDLTLYAQWEENEFLINFDLNGATVEKDVSTSTYIEKGTSAATFAESLAAQMTYVGHDFKGWFDEKLDPNSDEDATSGKDQANITSITKFTTVYAGWALSTYDVEFSLGYEGAPEIPTQKVKYGKLATEPTVNERDGYLFGGWFTDSEFVNQFTFDMKVTGKLTLYAKWIENHSTPENVSVKYYIGTTLYSEKTIAFNNKASSDAPTDPTKENAIFAGWYTDQEFKNKFNMNANLTQDVTVYAKFLDRYTFEAEATDLTGKKGQGTSTNSDEEGMIYDYTFVRDGINNVSNGYFIREMYFYGSSLDFVINSTKEVTDAVMYLRVSSECYTFAKTRVYEGKENNYLTDEEYKIVVNSEWEEGEPVEWLHYGGLCMPMANLEEHEDLDSNKTPFENRLITTSLHLKEGDNYIYLYVSNNNNHGGTFHAEAPTVDCMYIYSDASLEAFDYEFYTKENVKRG